MKKLSFIMTLALIIGTFGIANTIEVQATAKPLKGKISFWGGAHLTSMCEVVLEDFLAANPGVEISFEKYPFAEYPTKMKLQLSTGETVPDIMIIHDFLGQQFIKAGWLEDLTDVVDQSKLIHNYQTIMSNGRLYGIPLQASCMAFMYREDIFTDLGITIPTNYKQYMAAGKILKDNGYYLGAFSPTDNPQNKYLDYVNMMGGGIFDTEGNVILDTDKGKGVEALKLLKETYDAGYLHNSSGSAYWTMVNAGKIVALFAPSYHAPYIEVNVDPKGNGGWGSWRITAPFKVSEDGLTNYQAAATYLVINKRSKNKELALKIIKYLGMSIEGARAFTNIDRPGILAKAVNNYIPGLESIAKDSKGWPAFGGQKVLSFVAQTLLNEQPKTQYQDGRTFEAEKILGDGITKYFNGEGSAEDIINNVASQIRELSR